VDLLRHPAEPALQPVDVTAGDVTDPLPPRLDVPKCGTRCGQVGHRQQSLSLRGERLLRGEVLPLGGIPLGEHGGPRGEEGVLRGAEALPQPLVVGARGATGRLPLRHQLTEPARGGAPVGGPRQALRLRDDLLLACGHLLLGGLLLGEVSAAAPVEARPGGPEAGPQLVVGASVPPGCGTPGLHQLAEPVPGALPLVGVGERLRLGHEGLLRRPGRRTGLLAGLLVGGAPLSHRGEDVVEPPGEGVEVTDRVRVDDRGAQPVHLSGRLRRADPPGDDPLLEQGDLRGEVVVPAGEERQRLLGGGVGEGSHRPLTDRGAHVHGAVRSDPPPRSGVRAGARARRRGGGVRRPGCALRQGHEPSSSVTDTDVIPTGTRGRGGLPGSTPARPMRRSRSRPSRTWPKTVYPSGEGIVLSA